MEGPSPQTVNVRRSHACDMGSFFWRESGRTLLLPEEYELLSILKSLYGLSLEGACRPVIDPQGV